jgi:hypothetical protein
VFYRDTVQECFTEFHLIYCIFKNANCARGGKIRVSPDGGGKLNCTTYDVSFGHNYRI